MFKNYYSSSIFSNYFCFTVDKLSVLSDHHELKINLPKIIHGSIVEIIISYLSKKTCFSANNQYYLYL